MKPNTLQAFISILFVLMTLALKSQTVFIVASEIKSPKGKIMVSVFKDKESFDKEKPFLKVPFTKQGLVNGMLVLTFTLEPCTYGITILDDENDNSKMDYNLIGIPKEGFGFSNFYLEKLKKPSFDEFKTAIKPGKNKVDIRAKYL